MLKVSEVFFGYRPTHYILKNLTFNIDEGEIHALLGESGSGKSTLLRLLYGLLDANKGTIHWKNQVVQGPAYHLVPGMPFMKYVAQEFDIMPFVSVAENIGQYLSNRKPKEKQVRIDELLEVIHLTEYKNTPTKELSGGQRQRVALAQALAKQPELLILDEPFAHIDYHIKNTIARNLFDYIKKEKMTAIFSTHHAIDALHFADKILVLKEGKLLRHTSPEALYQHPKTPYEAQLTGEVAIVESRHFGMMPNRLLMLRPHQIYLSEEGIETKVHHCYFNGNDYLVEVLLDHQKIHFLHSEPIQKNTIIKISIDLL